MAETPGFFSEGSPRVMFYLGLVAGLAAVLTVNTLYVYAGGNLKLNVAEKPNKVAAAGDTNPTPTAVAPEPEPSGPVVPLKDTDHIRGNKNAKVVMIEYSDFECPFCGRHEPTMRKLAAEFGNQVAWVFRHFPLSFHAQAEPAANSSECASEQGKFWEFHDKVYENQGSIGTALFEKTASDLRLNMTQFKACVAAKKYASRISNDQAEGSTSGVNGTPATFINGKLVSGALPYESIKQMIQAELAQ
ncbi:MAG: thioredoxin domain-containing protein [bacterium]